MAINDRFRAALDHHAHVRGRSTAGQSNRCFVKILFVCHAIAMLLKSFDFPGFTLSMAWQPCNPCGLASSPAALLEQIKETVDEAHEFHDPKLAA